MDDADAGRHHLEGVERLLAPLEKFIALAVAVELQIEIEGEGVASAGVIDLHRVVDDQIDGHQGLDHFGVLAHGVNGGTHRRQIHQQGHAGEVLQHDARHHKRNFEVAGRLGVVIGEVGDVRRADLETVVVAQQ